MKRLLIATAALAAMAGAAAAQPAYDPSQGQAPSDYPHCTQPGQDRCVSGGHHMHGDGHHGHGHGHWHHGHGHHGHPGGKGGKSSTDGERG